MGTHDKPQWHRWVLRLGLSLAVGAGFLWVLRGHVQLVPRSFSVPVWVVPSYVAILLVYFLVRAGRWHLLLVPIGNVRFSVSLRCALAGIMWIMLLPLRLGEFARPLFIAQDSDIPVSKALGTVAIERVIDGLIVCGLFFAALATAPELARGDNHLEWLRAAGLFTAAGLACALITLVAMARWPAAVGRGVSRPLRQMSPGLADKVEGMARGISEGLAALPSPRPLLGFVGLTVLYWSINAVGMWVLAVGCGLDLSVDQAFAVMAVLGITLLLPSAPGMAGTFQAGVVLGLGLFLDIESAGDSVDQYVFFLYVCQLSVGVVLGFWSQWTLSSSWRSVFSSTHEPIRQTGSESENESESESENRRP